ncbi:MAG TPA: LPS assembly protein LptD [Steroidobacteraceae bacterium]|jgi:LPS-assembly protein|nr:LPS assembly protein LptD [Steroidobacteraceae bacterium]
MIAPLPLRTLLGVVICCAPLLAAWAAGERPVSASPEYQPDGGSSIYEAGCFSQSDAAAPVLLAQALPAPGSRRAPRSGPLQRLRGNRALLPQGPIVYPYSADHASADNKKGLVTLSGHVDVRMQDREIQADRITYDRNTNDFNIRGNVHFRDSMVQLQGDSGHYGDAGGQFSHAQFQFLGRPGRGSAQDMTLSPTDVVTVRNLLYTSCPRDRTDWDIRAHQLQLDTAANAGIARDAIVDFHGVPIFYLPYLSFPLSDARRSGFLFPNFGTSSRDGVILGAPWYWNIAPNQDATFTPTIYSGRGADAGVEYRFLSDDDSGTFDGNYMPHDWNYGAERSFVRLLDRLNLPDNSRVQADVESVSDDEYFEDFSQGVEATSTAFLPRNVSLTHRDDVFAVSLQTLDFQTIDNTLPSYERPYEETPRLDASANWSPAGLPWLRAGFDSDLVDFSRVSCALPGAAWSGSPGASFLCGQTTTTRENVTSYFPDGAWVNGWRTNVTPHVGLDLSGPGYFFRPSAAWDFAQYELRDVGAPVVLTSPGSPPQPLYAPGSAFTGASGDADPSRNVPIVTVDSGLTFDRLSSDGSRTVTLQPRVMYVYIPYRDQDQLPLFDTGMPDPNLIELFRPNRYVGEDRIGDANEFTLGLTGELFSTASGTRYVSATIGQSLYLNTPRVTLPGDQLGTHSSDLIGQVNVAAFHDWNVMLDVASNATVSRLQEVQAELQYRVNGQQVTNFSYQYADGLYQQIDGSTAWPVLPRWDLYARTVYSLMSRSFIEDFAGFQYRGSCWAIRVLYQSSLATRTGERDSGPQVQVELTGLSNVGSQVDTFLQQSIRGYLPVAPGRLPTANSAASALATPVTPISP